MRVPALQEVQSPLLELLVLVVELAVARVAAVARAKAVAVKRMLDGWKEDRVASSSLMHNFYILWSVHKHKECTMRWMVSDIEHLHQHFVR